jgi:hypothetical protein
MCYKIVVVLRAILSQYAPGLGVLTALPAYPTEARCGTVTRVSG